MNVGASPRSFARLKVTPMTPSIGAEIDGIDLSAEQDDETIAEIRAALLAHKVDVYKRQAGWSAGLPPYKTRERRLWFRRGPERLP